MNPEGVRKVKLDFLKGQIKFYEHRLRTVDKDLDLHADDEGTRKYKNIDQKFTFDDE